MKVELLVPRLWSDARGSLFEVHRDDLFPHPMVQTNVSRSRGGVLRGLHYQLERPQAKLVTVLRGAILDVAVDLRRSSSTFGEVFQAELSGENRHQLYVPAGYAHGFCVLSDEVEVLYHCSDYYHPSSERGVAWNDPQLAIPWPVSEPILSEKDAAYPPLREIPPDQLPP